MATDFGLAHLKLEGAPAHPEDVFIHCGCKKCEARWQKQLKAYEEYFMATKKTFEKSPKDKEAKGGPKEGSKKEEMMDKKQMKQVMKGKK